MAFSGDSDPAHGRPEARNLLIFWSHTEESMRHYTPVTTMAAALALALALLVGVLLPSDNAVHAVSPEFDADTTTRSVSENTPPGVNIGAPISATDDDEDTEEYGDTLTYSLGGTHAASFDIDSSTGQLITKAPLDAEGTITSYSVTVTVNDGTSDPVEQTVTIGVTDVVGSEPPLAPHPPTVVSGEDDAGTTDADESTTSLKVVWHPPESMGRPAPTGYTVEYKKSTATAFVITGVDQTGTETTATISGLDADTSYDVRVKATNGEQDTITTNWSLVGTGSTNRANNSPPNFNTPDDTACTDADICRTMPENETPGQNVGTSMPSASDANSVTKTYGLEGPDADSFVFDTSSRRIRTKRGVTYDFEAKSDYWVTVTVSDGHGATDAERVKITLDDVTEPPTAPSRPTVRPTAKFSTKLDVSWNAPDNTGRPDIIGYVLQYREGSTGAFTTPPFEGGETVHTTMTSFTIDGPDPDGLNPSGRERGEGSYQVQVRALNAEGNGAWSVVGTGRTSAANREPEFVDGTATITRYVNENTLRDTQAVRTVGARVAASDQDRDTLYYSLTPDDGDSPDNDAEFFTVDEKTGQIRTKSLLTHEGSTVCGYVVTDDPTTCIYTVTVEVRDRKDEHRNDAKDEDADDTIAVTIMVRDHDEPPAAPVVTVTSPGAEDGTTLAVIWDAPENTGPDIEGYKVEHRAGSSGSWTTGTTVVGTTETTITDLTANTSYQVRVRATTGDSDEGDGAWSRTLTAYTNKADNTAPTPSATTALSVEENTGSGQNIGDPVAATDPDVATDSDIVTYSLEGPQASKFTIDSRTGQIKTRAALNHEDPACGYTDGADGTTSCAYAVRVKAADRNRGSAASRVTITVTDDTDEPPGAPPAPTVRPTKDTSRSLDVSWREPQNAGPPITGYDIRYREGESGVFTILGPAATTGRTNTGETSATITGLDSGTDYYVGVRAISGEADTGEGWSPLTKARTAQGNQRPEFETSGPVTLRVVENTPSGRDVGSAFLAEDADGSRNRLRYSLEGPGAAFFTINAGTGQVRTKSPLDYESREFYSLTLKVDDGSRQDNSIAAKSVTVRVQDDIEPPSAPRPPSVTPVSGSTSSVRVTWEEPTNAGPPIEYYKVDYSRADNRDGGFNSWTHRRVDRSTIITGLTAGTRYVVRIAAHNAEGTGPWSNPGSGAPNRDTANRNPAFSGGSRSLSVAENTPTNTDIGAPIAATDQDGDPLRYSLEGPDAASFEIVSTGDGGQIRTVAELNHEEKSRYSVTVRVTDGRGGSDAVVVTITVTDEPDEAPSAPDAPTVTTVSSTSLQVSWEAPDNQGPPITDYDYRYREASESDWTQITNTTITGTTVTIESLRPGTFYDVEVRARNDEGVSDWSIAGFQTTAAPGANNPPVFTEGARATRTVSAAAPAGTLIGEPFKATDADSDDTLTFSLEGQDAASFDIGETTGQLATKAGSTLAAESTYTVIVVASDGTDSARITVTIEATAAPPNNPPVFRDGATTTRSVPDNATAGRNVGTPVSATDADAGDTIVYSLEGTDAASFSIVAASGQILTRAALDAGVKSTYSVTVVASDGKGRATIAVTITVIPNNLPVFSGGPRSFTVRDNASAGTFIGSPIRATDADAGDTITYSLEGTDAASFGIQPSTAGGQIVTRSGVTLTAGTSYSVTVRATDSRGGSATLAVTITAIRGVFGCGTNGAVSDASNTGLVSDCEALLRARNQLEGSARLNWSEFSPIANWQGIFLGGTPTRVTVVALPRQNLNGTIPADLGDLLMLTQLNLHSNDLSGSIPPELNRLSRLQRLFLHNNRLSGTIPNLSGLRNLERLWLSGSNMNLSGGVPAWLNSMNRLEQLSLWGNNLGGSIPRLTGMASLRLLKLQSNNLTGSVPAWFGDMNGPSILYLHDNNLSGPIPANLGRNTGVVRLWLDRNDLSGPIPRELGNMSGLRTLNLHGNQLTGSIPPELGNLSSLQHIGFHNNRRFNDSGIVLSSGLTGPIPSELGNLSGLTRLALSNNSLTGTIPSELGNLGSLSLLWLSQNRLSGAIPSQLGALGDTLTNIKLAENSFDPNACVPRALANVATNDYSAAGLSICP